MSREIKFRAWDLKESRWVNHNELLNQTQVSASVRPPSILTIFHTNWQLMQYTGLKDKNGKEIYEGDLVKLGQDINPKVVKINPYYGVTPIAGHCTGYWQGRPEDFEVIGNIYENPELLNV